jgi:hypothetical protein
MNEDELRRILSDQQRHSDDQLTNFRRFYESFPAEERARVRAWLVEPVEGRDATFALSTARRPS